jgi:uncharacterized membrane protein YebE (DUF533 family)
MLLVYPIPVVVVTIFVFLVVAGAIALSLLRWWSQHRDPRNGPMFRSVERAIAERDRATTMAEVVIRAAFADGDMKPTEWAAIERMCRARFGADADLADVRSCVMADYGTGVSPRRLDRDVTRVAWTLEDADRAELAALVEELASEGGSIALLDGYRGGSSGDPGQLVDVIRRALGPGRPGA